MRDRETEDHVQAVLAGIANRARENKAHRFGGLYSLLNEGLLRWSFYQLNRKAAPGVDGVTWREYEGDLDANLRDLVDRLKRKAYRTTMRSIVAHLSAGMYSSASHPTVPSLPVA